MRYDTPNPYILIKNLYQSRAFCLLNTVTTETFYFTSICYLLKNITWIFLCDYFKEKYIYMSLLHCGVLVLVILLLIQLLPPLYGSIFKKLKKLKIYSSNDANISWGNEGIKENEKELLDSTKEIIRKHIKSNKLKKSDWLYNTFDVDILRFLRLNLNKTNKYDDVVIATFNDLLLHNKWRQSKYGLDNINKHSFDRMTYLNNYIHWLGQDCNGYPTLYIKSQLHDGKYYNEDPKLFTGYIVWILENGRHKYGNKKINVILDRSSIDNDSIKENTDVNVMTSLVELYKTLYSEIYPNFPDLLNEFKIFHTSWVFNICLTIAMKIFDNNTRSKFKIYKNDKEIKTLMKDIFPNNNVLPHYSYDVKNNYLKTNMKNDTYYSDIYYCFN